VAPAARVQLAVLVALAAMPGRARAQTPSARAQTPSAPRARLTYVVDAAAEPCPTADELRAAIEARVGHAVFGEPAAFTLDVRVRRDGAAFVATVALPDAPGEGAAARELRSDASCAELLSAAALVASIAVDPASLLRPAPPSAPPPPAPAAPRTWRALVGLGPRAAWGLTPAPTVGLALSAAAVGARRALGAELRGFLPTDADHERGRVTVLPLSLSVLPCRLWRALEACAVAQLGLIHGGATGLAQDFSTWNVFAGGGARGAAFVDRGPLRLRASLEGDVLLPRTSFLVSTSSVYTTRGVSLSGGLDALLFF
jgi:hypothetical protein